MYSPLINVPPNQIHIIDANKHAKQRILPLPFHLLLQFLELWELGLQHPCAWGERGAEDVAAVREVVGLDEGGVGEGREGGEPVEAAGVGVAGAAGGVAEGAGG